MCLCLACMNLITSPLIQGILILFNDINFVFYGLNDRNNSILSLLNLSKLASDKSLKDLFMFWLLKLIFKLSDIGK